MILRGRPVRGGLHRLSRRGRTHRVRRCARRLARDPRRRALVLIAIRADFYGRCAAYPELSRLLDANHVLVGPMRRDELRRAIELPAQRAGPACRGRPGRRPDRRRRGRAGRAAAALDRAAGAVAAARRPADALRAYEQRRRRARRGRPAGRARPTSASTPSSAPLARRILLRLAGDGEGDAVVRRRVPLAELERDGVAEVLDVLADGRLVTIERGRGRGRPRGAAARVAAPARVARGGRPGPPAAPPARIAAREWDAGGRDPGELYRGARLASTLEWAADHDAELNAGERGFLGEPRGERALGAPRARRAGGRRRAAGARGDRRRRRA